jgi:hypothetical protein
MVMFRRALATLLALFTFWPTLVLAQQEKAGVVTTLEGTVTATRGTAPVSLKFKDDVFLRDRITTGDRSLARMLLGGKAVVTVRERSILNITEVPGRSTVDLESGKIALAVAREKLRPGEQIEIRTPNAVAAVRGTVVVAEVLRASAQAGAGAPAVTTNFYVLRGTVLATQLDPVTRAPVGPPQPLNVLQSFTATGNAPPRIAPIPPEQVQQVTSGLQPQGVQATEAGNRAQVREQAVLTATNLVNRLVGPTPGGGLSAPAPLPIQPVTTTTNTLHTEYNALCNGSQQCETLMAVIATAQAAVAPPLCSAQGCSFVALSGIPFFTTTAGVLQFPITIAGPLQGDPFVLSGGTLNVQNSVFRFSTTLNRTSLAALAQISNSATLNLLTADPAIAALAGANLTLASPLLTVANSIINLPREALLLRGAIVTGNDNGTLVQFRNSTLNAGANFAFIENGRLTLAGALLTADGSTLVNGVESGPNANTLAFALAGDGAVIRGTSSDPFVQLTNSTVSSSGSLFTARNRFGGPAPTVDLAGPLLRAAGGSFRSFSSAFFDQSGARQLCCNLLAVGQGTRFTSTTTTPLIQLNGTALNLGNRVISIFDFTSILGEPTVVATPSVTLAGALLSMTGGTVAALQNVLGVFRGTLSSTTTDPLLAFDGTTINIGGPSPIDGSTTTGRLVTLALSNSTGNPALTNVSLRGPLWKSTNATILTTDDAFGIFDGSTLSSTSGEPLISITGGSATAGGTGNFFTASSAAGNAPVSITLAGPLVAAANTTIQNGLPTSNTQSFVFIGNGTSFTSTGTGPLMSFSNTTVDTSANILTLRNTLSQAIPSMSIAGPLLVASNNSSFNTTSLGFLPGGSRSACCSGFFIGQGGRLTGTGAGALIQLTSSTFSAGPDSQSGGTFFHVTATNLGESLTASASVNLAGPLLSMAKDPVTQATPNPAASRLTSLFSTLSVNQSSFTSTSPVALMTVTDSSTLTAGGTNVIDGTTTYGALLLANQPTANVAALATSVSLAGPLLSATSSTLSFTGDVIGVFNGATLASTTTAPLVTLSGGTTLRAGSTAFSGRLLSVSGAGGTTGSATAAVTLAGPVLLAGPLPATISPDLSFTNDVIGVLSGARLTSTTTAPLISLIGTSTLSAGSGSIGGRLLNVSGSTGSALSTVTLAGPLLSATGSTTSTFSSDVIGVFQGGQLTSTTTSPLITLSNSTLNAGSAGFDGRVLSISALGGPVSSGSPATVTLNGPLLSVGSILNATHGLVRVQENANLQVNGSTDPLTSFTGGTHAIATAIATDSAMFRLSGRTTAFTTEAVGGETSAGAVNVTTGTDVPLSHGGVFMEAKDATFGSGSTVPQKFYLQDNALVQASMPILRLTSATGAPGSSLTTALDAIDLSNKAKLTAAGNLVELIASTLTVNSGAAVRVNDSLLRVSGDLFSLSSGSTLRVSNGAPLSISGTAVVNITGVMYRFGTGSNTVNITNTACGTSCLSFGGLNVAIQNGASSSNISVGSGGGIAGSGTITRSAISTADVILSGANSRLVITGTGGNGGG